MPIALFVGGKDALSTEKDVLNLKDTLGNVVDYHYYPSFEHSTFIESWAWTPKYRDQFL